MTTYRPLRAIRLNCLECSGGSPKYVKYCPCDGVHSTRCHLWPYRMGKRPETMRAKYGAEFVTPGALPLPNVQLETIAD